MSNSTFEDVFKAKIGRRKFLQAMGYVAGVSAVGMLSASTVLAASRRSFHGIAHSTDVGHNVAEGYEVQTLLSWGDVIIPHNGDAAFLSTLTPDQQLHRFGFNNDYVAFMSLPKGSQRSDHGLLCVNHEMPDTALMFADYKEGEITKSQCDVEMAAVGMSIVEVKKQSDGRWEVVQGQYNRRISASHTLMRISGPAAGHARMQTSADLAGEWVLGTLNNCAGGITPWGTVLTAEENVNNFFGGDLAGREEEGYQSMGVKPKPRYDWMQHEPRFDVSKEPNEINRFGWLVEVDPYDPASIPIKRTGLGRFKHECAVIVVAQTGQVVVYSGDDERFEHIYKYVSKGVYKEGDDAHNATLLDEGVLSVAQFDQDSVTWLPLEFGVGGLTEESGFMSQADVLIDARKAAKIVGATPMDRPEGMAINPVTGGLYVVLTNNHKREEANVANPRSNNAYGHIIDIKTASHEDDKAAWDIFLLAGDPYNPQHQASYMSPVSKDGWFACPDNIAFDKKGRAWVTTDGQPKAIGKNDGVFVVPTVGASCGASQQFFNAPVGAEVTGPAFTPDNTTFFIAVQHPGDGGTFANPITRWPHFNEALPSLPSVLAINIGDGGEL